jgi:hypothetical protein
MHQTKIKYKYNDQVEEDKIDGTYSTKGGKEERV